ncbi:RDD family protein [Microbacterium sp. BWT-B31]|uniref:RDD family protein n=1 Tax=Microbacterium sp. BWT-B31 TaxID=3232072 RepID=UPI0035280CCD
MTTVSATAAVPASLGRRVGAYAIDIAIAWGIQVVLVCIGAGVVIGSGANREERSLAVALLFMYLLVGVASLAWAFVYTAMQGGRGSIGQRALGLRLADAGTGARIGFGRALGRNIIWALAGSIVVGYFSPLFDSSGRRQGWHDLVAKAVVIDAKATDASSRPEPEVAAAVANPYLPPPAGAAPVAAPPASPSPPVPQFTRPAPPVPAPGGAGPGGFAAPAAPAAPTGALAVAQSGLISVVPGVTSEQAAAARATPPAPGGVATGAASTAVADDLDATRAVAPGGAGRPASVRESAALAVLTWDDGTRAAVYGRTLFGRNPAAEGDATVIAVRDETLSLSKTHFEVGGDASGLWVVDRHSTNGTTLVRDGARSALVAGTSTALRPGDRLEFGDRSATVSAT